MKLPNADAAITPERKITEYLLSLTHPAGRSKAAYFMRFGFDRAQWQMFASALRRHAAEHDVVETEDTPYGISYTVEGPLSAPDGRAPQVRVVWFIETGQATPRLVTVYPLKRGGPMIDELDSVVLKTDVPEHKLRAGDVGTVVMVHDGGRGYTVEFVTLGGETVGVVTLSASHVRAVRPNEIAHVREVAASS